MQVKNFKDVFGIYCFCVGIYLDKMVGLQVFIDFLVGEKIFDEDQFLFDVWGNVFYYEFLIVEGGCIILVKVYLFGVDNEFGGEGFNVDIYGQFVCNDGGIQFD